MEAEELDGRHIDFSVRQIIQIYHEQAVALESNKPAQVPRRQTPCNTGSTDSTPTQEDKISDLQKRIPELITTNKPPKQSQPCTPAESKPTEASPDTQELHQEFWEKDTSIDPMKSCALHPNVDGVWIEIVIPNLSPKCITTECSADANNTDGLQSQVATAEWSGAMK